MDAIQLNLTSKVIKFEKINEQFSQLRCGVLALGKNANKSHLSREAVEAALPGLCNIPVVAHLKKADDGSYYIGGHDRRIIIEDNQAQLQNLTVPFGVVPENCNPTFEEIPEPNGTRKTYLCCDMIVWSGRYPELLDAKYSENIFFNQSMEIDPLRVEPMKGGYTDIKEFTFSALCLLGKSDDPAKNTEPCFPMAQVTPIFSSMFALMMKEYIQFCKEGGTDMSKEQKNSTPASEPNALEALQADYDKLKGEFTAYKASHQTPDDEVSELRRFRDERLAKDRKDAEDALFAQFEGQLAEVKEFADLKQNTADMGLPALEEKLYALLGRQNKTFARQELDEPAGTVKVAAPTSTNAPHDPYDGLHAQYLD